ncbi:PREDICTED: peroxisomal membrane protein PMP34-like isoform X2 [Branchiostoma belcheri]|uniref:Peroxisomal membrane protein PMP34-like isoform X2 n=1 Tax=Branchiostoma belcheri TaxID=7741 RepID=A0A6P4ZYL3_BRABE|nr:PREDICTED: peroxisomal membrane protein PMP34-like isoform X2 [Branchiostoma belcheri]
MEDVEDGIPSPIGLFSYDNLIHAVAGATGSVTAMSVFFPLDTARLRLQVDDKRKAKYTHEVISEISKEEGVKALYRGWFPVVSSLCCSNFVYFYTYNGLKTIMNHQPSGPLKDLCLAFMAGVVNVLLTTPMWVVNTRLKLQGAKFTGEEQRENKPPHYKGIMDAFRRIVRDEGVSALWSGTLPSLILVFNPAIQFMFYEGFKRSLTRVTHQELNAWQFFLVGALAKGIATVSTYPLQLIQSKLRSGRNKKAEEGRQTSETFRSVVVMIQQLLRKQGLKGLYKGLEAKLLQTVLTAALMFLIYEKIAAFVFSIMRPETVLEAIRRR